MSKHTPGPWSVEQNGFYRSAVTANKGLSHMTWKAGTDRMSREEIEANASLIAAAPDMLSALELVKRRLNTCLCDDVKMGEGMMNRLLEDVSEAIARAKGEQV